MALGHMFWLHGKIHKQRQRQEFSLQMTHYLEHVRVFIVCVLHHHGLVPRQSVGYAVLAFAADSLIVRGEKKIHLNLILATGQCSVPAHGHLSTRKTQHWPALVRALPTLGPKIQRSENVKFGKLYHILYTCLRKISLFATLDLLILSENIYILFITKLKRLNF